MKYKSSINFDELKNGDIVEGVPIEHEIFQEYEQYIEPRRNKAKWLARIEEMKEAHPFEDQKGYYCLNCDRLEDGSHRYDLFKNYLNLTEMDIEIGDICYKGLKGNLEYMIFKRAIKHEIGKKDLDWLEACEKSKLNHLIDIDYKDKKILDVGCQLGLTVLTALKMGAKKAIGVEMRSGILGIAKEIKKLLGLTNQSLELKNIDFLNYKTTQKFDIVFCMGMIHYFGIEDYEKVFDKLVKLTRGLLILELRVTDGAGLIQKKQILATNQWLYGKAKELKLKVIKSITRDFERELWIFEKGV